MVSPALRRAHASLVGDGLQPRWDLLLLFLLLLLTAVTPQCYCQQTQQNPKPGKIWVTMTPTLFLLPFYLFSPGQLRVTTHGYQTEFLWLASL